MTWSSILKGISALLISVALIGGASFFAVRFFVDQFTASPPRPTFPNDPPSPSPKAKQTAAIAAKPSPAPSASPSPEASPSPQPSPNTKRARITLGEGLNVRQEPNAEAERVGGVDYSDEVDILEESPDKEWLRVRVASSGIEGWIKSGYTETVSEGGQ